MVSVVFALVPGWMECLSLDVLVLLGVRLGLSLGGCDARTFYLV